MKSDGEKLLELTDEFVKNELRKRSVFHVIDSWNVANHPYAIVPDKDEFLRQRHQAIVEHLTKHVTNPVLPADTIKEMADILNNDGISRHEQGRLTRRLLVEIEDTDDTDKPKTIYSVSVDCVVDVEVEEVDGYTDEDYKNEAVDQAVSLFDFATVYGATCDF